MDIPRKCNVSTLIGCVLTCGQVDDAWDEGGLTEDFTADHVQAQVQACWDILDLEDPSEGYPQHPFAAMLQR
jgi:hypothetical protein